MSSLSLGCGYIAGTDLAFYDAPILKSDTLEHSLNWPEHSLFAITFYQEKIDSTDVQRLNELLSKQVYASLILATTEQSAPGLLAQIKVENRYFDILSLQESKESMTTSLLKAFERSQNLKQEFQLKGLLQSQNQKLADLQVSLENRIAAKQTQLIETKHRVLFAQTRFETLQQCLFIIQNSKSALEFSEEMAPALARGLQADFVKLCWSPAEAAEAFLLKNEFKGWSKTSIVYRSTPIGELIIARKSTQFSALEKSFFEELCEFIALYWDRLQKLQRVVDLKENWQITFDAIENPVALISKNYQVIQANKSFFKEDSGTKCYEILFNRSAPCENCKLGQAFRIRSETLSQSQYWEVKSQKVPNQEGFFLNHYHELTDRLNLENDLLQNAKAAEIGTIASSLAHELNNPLGALLNFVQLLKMDTPAKTPLFEDLVEMELAAKRSTELIQNILSFARDLSHSTDQNILYTDLVSQTVQFIELLYRFRKVKFNFSRDDKFQFVSRHPSLMKQVLRYLLSSLVNLQQDRGSEMTINIKLTNIQKNVSLQLQVQFAKPSGKLELKISLAQSLMKQIHGSIHMTKNSSKGLTLTCLIPVNVF